MCFTIGLLSLTSAVVGCADGVHTDGWGFAGPSGETSDVGAATGESEEIDVVRHSSDTGRAMDTRRRSDDTSDATGDGREDARAESRRIEEEGWLIQGLERSEFVPQKGVYPRVRFEGDACTMNGLHNSARERERWWAAANPDPSSSFVETYPPGDGGVWPKTSFFRASGTLSPEGEYGHLGAYDRRFEMRTLALHVCRTVARLQHCAVPTPERTSCVTLGDRTFGGTTGEDGLSKRSLKRIVEGPGIDGPGEEHYVERFELVLKHDRQSAHGLDRIRVAFENTATEPSSSPDESGEGRPRTLAVREGLSAEIEAAWVSYAPYSIRYRDISGWVGWVPETSPTRLEVNLRGTNPVYTSEFQPSEDATDVSARTHVWGTYTVDSTMIPAKPK